MMSPFSFQGKIEQRPYALWSLSVLFIDYALIGEYALIGFVAVRFLGLSESLLSSPPIGAPTESTWWIFVLAYFAVRLVFMLLEMWVLGALALRRAVDADINRWIATLAVVPFLQIPVIVYLCVAPSRVEPTRAAVAVANGKAPFPLWAAILLGLVAGILLTLFAVAVSTLVFGSYSTGLFLLAPFAIGCATSYLANYKVDIGGRRTALSVVAATLLGTLALVAVALEGLLHRHGRSTRTRRCVDRRCFGTRTRAAGTTTCELSIVLRRGVAARVRVRKLFPGGDQL